MTFIQSAIIITTIPKGKVTSDRLVPFATRHQTLGCRYTSINLRTLTRTT